MALSGKQSQFLENSDVAKWNACCGEEGVHTADSYLGLFLLGSIYDLLWYLLRINEMPA